VGTATTVLFTAYGIAMLAAIASNYSRLTDPNERRRLRVLVAGGAAGTLPALLRLGVMSLAPGSALNGFLISPAPDAFIVVVFLLFPVSFAYAVLRHRLFGIRVIVRMGLQYALARGVVLSVVPLLALALVSDALAHGDQPLVNILAARGWVYGLVGALAVAIHTQRHRWSSAIDRRFFRDQYDASRLLREVADQARRARSLERAAPGVVARVEAALHPEFVALLFRPEDEARFRCITSSPVGHVPPPIDAHGTLAARLRAAEEPLELTGRDAEKAGKWTSGLEPEELRRARVELLVPIAMGSDRHEAILALGPKRSEEPYTPDDLAALEAIASSLALLAESVAPQPGAPTGTFVECPVCGGCHDAGTAACPQGHAALVPIGMPRTLGGRYRLERRLGRGGMGTVYEAVDIALDRRVAVKVVRDEWVHNTLATQRFRREARAVAGFAHPNVVTVYDYGADVGSRVFLVMELLSGATLREALRHRGPLDAARTVSVLRGVCSAVDAAHHRGFIHRDLKPENIFLVDAGGPVKVLDFGVVKPLMSAETAEPGEPPETEVGVLVGTVGYMSPEQLLGDRPSISWDVWALTVVAYECLTAALPFPADSRESWRQLVLTGRHRPLGDHLGNPPAAWQGFFDRALTTDRSGRPVSAAEFFRQLERALS
jgi:tRNA A-37 threonylcarbamoyl transferase component Bud32